MIQYYTELWKFHSTPSRKMPYSCLATIYRHMIRNSPLKKRATRKERAEMCPAIVSGIITGDAPVIYWPFFYQLYRSNPGITFLLNLFLSLHPLLFFLFLCKLCLLPLYFQSIFGVFCYFCQRKPTLYQPHGFLGLSCHILTKLCNLLPCHNKVAILTKNK